MIDSTVPEIRTLIGSLTHDVRNGLNGMELEASLLEVLHEDERTQESIRRMRRQIGEIESALRFLVARFTESEVELAPAIDVFHLWRSHSKCLSHFDLVDWKGDVGDALISVDASMVANALCESLSYAKGAPLEASVRREGSEVLFEIRQGAGSPEKKISSVKEWPLLGQMFLQNGARLETSGGDGSTFFRRCWFPSCEVATE